MTDSSALSLRKKTTIAIEIGWAERIDLPELGLHQIRAKIDSGAATSSIHATRIKPYQGENGDKWVEFWFRAHRGEPPRKFRAPLLMKRKVKSSNGEVQIRYVIETTMVLGEFAWHGRLTLADRGKMNFPMLIGRRALRRGFMINAGKKWTQNRETPTDHKALSGHKAPNA